MDRAQLIEALNQLGLGGRLLEVHSSLSSLGTVSGGADTVVDALVRVCDTCGVPSYSGLGRTAPPAWDHPPHNGVGDYVALDELMQRRRIEPFDPASFGPESAVNREMGAIPRALLRRPGTLRSKHPSTSWAAHGPRAREIVGDHPVDDPNAPLRKLYREEGLVLLLGVDLTRCSSLHLAEERAERRPFIRWVRYADGVVRRIREFGCSDGFELAFSDALADLERRGRVGSAEARLYPVRGLVDRAAEVIRRDPHRTVCPDSCIRCRDAVRGGPDA